jgi:murein tripeptide amidase MpaA
MEISSAFDGGNIGVIEANAPSAIRLEIRKDAHADFYQWFYFRLTGAKGRNCAMRIINAGGAAYPAGWKDYRALASYDRKTWFRVDTAYDGAALTIRHRPAYDAVYYAYFAPYSMERHGDLIARCLASPHAALDVPGYSLDGQAIDILYIGKPGGGQPLCWFLARQHPGETMAEWWMEGFLDRLLDKADPLATRLLETLCFAVVPNMNPDGARRGHLRTNAAGVNLNRAWSQPSLERSPEVFHVRREMERRGVDFCLDVHGDEALPHVFIAGPDGIPGLSARQRDLLASYKQALVAASPDFQTAHGYPPAAPGKANLAIATNFIAERFGCLAMTLEQPFKDNADAPDATFGWSPERCRALGRAALEALATIASKLR